MSSGKGGVMKSYRLALCLGSALLATAAAAAPRVPHVAQRIPLRDGGWDILIVDPGSKRVLASRSDGVDAIDTRTNAVIPQLVGGTRFHGVTSVPGAPLAVASEAAGSAIVFNPRSGKVRGEVRTDPDADAAIYEPITRAVWVMDGESGTISIIDPVAVRLVGKVEVGGSLEFPALDGRGHLFVNVEDKGELVEVNIATRTVMKRIPLAGCERPTGLAYLKSGVLLSACANGVAKITRAGDGKPLGAIAIGPRPDGAFADPARDRAYVPSGGDGTLAVIDTSGTLPRKIATVRTEVGARTGAVDPSTGAVYLIAAKFGPTPPGGGHPPVVPGTVELLVVR
jgi:DNA-binding beta-propeller fold protein YncE